MTKTFRHIIILLITISVGFGIGYFWGRNLLKEDLERNRIEYAKDIATLDSLMKINDGLILNYEERVVSLDKELKKWKKQASKEKIIYRDIEQRKTSNEVVKSLKEILNEKD